MNPAFAGSSIFLHSRDNRFFDETEIANTIPLLARCCHGMDECEDLRGGGSHFQFLSVQSRGM